MTSHSIIFAFVFHFPLTSKHKKNKKKWTPITLRRGETVAKMASVEIQTAFFRWCRRGKKDIKREKDQRTRTQWSIITKKKIPPKNEKKNKTSKGKLHFSSILEPSFFVVQIIFAFWKWNQLIAPIWNQAASHEK